MAANKFNLDNLMKGCKNGSLRSPGDYDTIRDSLKALGNPDAADAEGKTGIIHGVINGRRGVVSLLLEESADINLQDKLGKSALHYAADAEDQQMIVFLLMNRADSNAADKEGLVPGSGNGKIRMFIDDVGRPLSSSPRSIGRSACSRPTT